MVYYLSETKYFLATSDRVTMRAINQDLKNGDLFGSFLNNQSEWRASDLPFYKISLEKKQKTFTDFTLDLQFAYSSFGLNQNSVRSNIWFRQWIIPFLIPLCLVLLFLLVIQIEIWRENGLMFIPMRYDQWTTALKLVPLHEHTMK